MQSALTDMDPIKILRNLIGNFEGGHPVVCGQLSTILVPSLHNI